MKIQLGVDAGSYSFNHLTKVVTLNNPGVTITLDRVLAIVNTTTGQTLYGLGYTGLKAAAFTPGSAALLTLNAGVDTSGMADTDALCILIDDALNNVTPQNDVVDYSPFYGPTPGGKVGDSADPSGNKVIRGQMLTDEGGYRANFSGSSLAVPLGVCTFTNGDTAIVGAGFDLLDVHAGDYVYKTSDGIAYAVQVDYLTLTVIYLKSPYLGTSGAGTTSRQILLESVGPGASVTVANSNCIINSGTTDSSRTDLDRGIDYLPMARQTGLTISQRILNQDIYCGYYDNVPTPKWYYWFHFNGNDPTKVICECAFNANAAPSGKEIRQQLITCPNTGVFNRYRTEALRDRVQFYINDVLVATEYANVPRPHDILSSTVNVVNGVGIGTIPTVITIDFDACQNFNAVTTDASSQAPLPVSGRVAIDDGAILMSILKTLQYIANPMNVDTNGRQRVLLDSITGSLTLGTVSTVSTLTTLNQVASMPANSFIYDTMHAAWAHAIRPRVT